MRRNIRLLAILLVASAAAPASAEEPGAWQGREVTVDGVVHVKNPSAGMEAPLVMKTKELWSLGESESDVVFGDVGAALRDPAGNTYLLDVQLSQIHVVDADGGYRGTIGGPGEGPAEFFSSSGMTFLSDSVLCVSQVMPPRLVEISVSGRAVGDYPVPRDLVTALVNGCASVDGGVVLALGQLSEGETSVGFRTFFQLLDAKGELGPTYWEKFQKADFANITFDEKEDAGQIWAVGDDGRVFVYGGWDAYEIEAVEPDGSERRVFEREYEPLDRPAWQKSLVESKIDKQEMAAETVLAEKARTIESIVPRPGGVVWFLTGRGENEKPDDVLATFDEFDRSGRFVRSVSVLGEYEAGRDALYVDGDHIVVVMNGGPLGGAEMFEDSDEIAVRCLELVSE